MGHRTFEEQLGMSESRRETNLLNLQAAMTPEPTLQEEGTDQVHIDSLEVIEACRNSLDFLAAMAMPTSYRFEFPPTHKTAWQILIQYEEGDEDAGMFPQVALGIPRGHAKTTLIKLWALRCVLFSRRRFFLITAAIETHAVNILSDIIGMLDEPNIRSTFGNWREGIEMDRTNGKKFGFRGRNIAMFAVGAEGAVRGFNVKNDRPDMMIFDDIQTKENAESPVMSKSLETWMVGTAMKSKSPTGCMFIFAGNMFPTPYSILKKLKDNPTWIKFISGAILADGTALWPKLRSLKSLLAEFDNDVAMGHPEIFFSEVLNDVQAGMNTNVDFSKFPQWKWTLDDLPQGKFIVVDPSAGKGIDSDVIGLFEVYDGQLGFRSVVEAKLSPGNLIRQALLLAVRNGVTLIAIEAMAYQFTLLYWFEEVCKTIGIVGITCVPLYANSHSKNSRIAAGLKSMQSSEIVLHGDVKSQVMKQVADWNPMKKVNIDDILDVIAYAPKVMSEYQYEIMTKENLQVIDASGARVREDNHLF